MIGLWIGLNFSPKLMFSPYTLTPSPTLSHIFLAIQGGSRWHFFKEFVALGCLVEFLGMGLEFDASTVILISHTSLAFAVF